MPSDSRGDTLDTLDMSPVMAREVLAITARQLGQAINQLQRLERMRWLPEALRLELGPTGDPHRAWLAVVRTLCELVTIREGGHPDAE